MTDARVDPPLVAGERQMLLAWLDWHRGTLLRKCEGLTDEQLVRQASPPSTLSLLGLVRHMAEVERTWFRRVLSGEDVPLVYSPDGDFQTAYDTDGADVAEAFANWRAEVALARHASGAAASLDVTGLHTGWQEHVSLRWVLVHMIEEYARHNGHADLLREAIDGTTGP